MKVNETTLRFICAGEEPTTSVIIPDGQNHILRFPSGTQKNLEGKTVIKNWYENKSSVLSSKHQFTEPESLDLGPQTKSRLFLKVLFICNIRGSVFKWSCAFDLYHVGNDEQHRTAMGDLVSMQTNSGLTKHFLLNIISLPNFIFKWPIVPGQPNISLLYKQNLFA